MTIPNRTHLINKLVRLTLSSSANPDQPTEGIFLGQSEAGLTIEVAGRGGYRFAHSEIKSVHAV